MHEIGTEAIIELFKKFLNQGHTHDNVTFVGVLSGAPCCLLVLSNLLNKIAFDPTSYKKEGNFKMNEIVHYMENVEWNLIHLLHI